MSTITPTQSLNTGVAPLTWSSAWAAGSLRSLSARQSNVIRIPRSSGAFIPT